MKVSRVSYSSGPSEVLIRMSEPESRELLHQLLAFWQGVAVGRQPPRGETPVATIYNELEKLR